MNQLQVIEQKLIPFGDHELLAVKMADGKIYTSIALLCRGVGLSEKQKDAQVAKIQSDMVLNQGFEKLPLKFEGQVREYLCIELDYLPLWLAKISITPQMQQTNPLAVENLVNYQLKAKDVLAEAFLPKMQPTTQAELIAMMAQQGVEQERRLNQVEQRTAELEAQQENITQIVSLNPMGWKDKVNAILNRIAIARGGGNQFQIVRNESYELLEARARCKLGIRLDNRKKEALANGIISKAKIAKFKKIDVIEADTKLTEIYLAIVKEMAIAHKVNAEGLGA